MKWVKSRNQWEASNVTFDPSTLIAKSYGWWVFCARIGGHVVFNDYGYSVSTRGHQRKVARRLELDGINRSEIVTVECPRGLQDLQSGIDYAREKIAALEAEISKPRTQKGRNEQRRDEIVNWQLQIVTLENLMRAEGMLKDSSLSRY